LVAGAGFQRYLALVTAFDIASRPAPLSALLSSLEGARAIQGRHFTEKQSHSSMGGRKNG
ncbi:MAG: hypothetical protein KDC43_14840, partial [Saprospiraceae bacterium]|nr:hypothetical protein [Saprospiraceae bacterium]